LNVFFHIFSLQAEDDLRDKLIFEEERLIEAQAHNGEVITVDHKINLQTYSRRKSMTSELTGFTNYEGAVPVRMGGGFRLQVDNFIFVDDQPHMTLSAYFSFNDMGSRVLAQTCEEDCLVPRYETSIQLKIEDGRIMFPDSLSEGDENLIVTNEAGEVVNQVLKSLFKRDGQAISDLLQGLVSIRPAMKVHQLEGIFSVPSEKEISAEVIDFDGIDSFDITGQTTALSPAERLMSGKLKRVGYLQTDPASILSYISFRSRVQDAVRSLTESDIIGEDVKAEISRHFPNSPYIITKEQTGAVKLGRLLKSIGVDWEETDNLCIKQFQSGENLITAISIEGYELAFWKKGSTLVDCKDIKTLSRDLSDLVGVKILPVHLSSLREGD